MLHLEQEKRSTMVLLPTNSVLLLQSLLDGISFNVPSQIFG
jgi:membrane protein required for beta-lactamase induction